MIDRMAGCTYRIFAPAALAAVALSILPAPEARAARVDGEPSEESIIEARVHFQAGKIYYDKEKYRQAITEFQAGYDLIKKPAFLLNIAQSYRKLGDYRKAKEYYSHYLDEDPQSVKRAEVEKMMGEIDSEIAEAEKDSGGAAPAAAAGGDEDSFGGGAARPPAPRRPPPRLAAAPEAVPQASDEPSSAPAAAVEGGEDEGASEEVATAKASSRKARRASEAQKPIYAKAWFWTVIGLALVGGAAGAYFATQKKDYVTDGTLGNIDARQKM